MSHVDIILTSGDPIVDSCAVIVQLKPKLQNDNKRENLLWRLVIEKKAKQSR